MVIDECINQLGIPGIVDFYDAVMELLYSTCILPINNVCRYNSCYVSLLQKILIRILDSGKHEYWNNAK